MSDLTSERGGGRNAGRLTSERGGGRNAGRERGYAPAPASKGANPLIGAFLMCGGRGPSANETSIWASKLKEFAMSHYETNIDNILVLTVPRANIRR